MPYTVTFGRFGERGEAVAAVIEPEPFELSNALERARWLISNGEQDVAIHDAAGNRIDGDDLIACCREEKELTLDLRAIPNPT